MECLISEILPLEVGKSALVFPTEMYWAEFDDGTRVYQRKYGLTRTDVVVAIGGRSFHTANGIEYPIAGIISNFGGYSMLDFTALP